MLLNMRIKNFKCFKNETFFDFSRTNYQLLDSNVNGKCLKGVLFVGDNASGKTTALHPIRVLLDLLLQDVNMPLYLFRCLFSKEERTMMEYSFDIDDHLIEYGFQFSKNGFAEEYLRLDGSVIINRLDTKASLNLSGETSFYDVDSMLLFLKKVYFRTKFDDNDILKEWFRFLEKSVFLDAYKRQITSYNGEPLVIRNYLDHYGTDDINSFLSQIRSPYRINYARSVSGGGVVFQSNENEEKGIFFTRGQSEVPIPWYMESTGTVSFFNMLPTILYTVKNGGMLIIDEFSSGLHNKLEELLVRYMMREGKSLQLFMVSHSTNLLSTALLRPDQIYAVEFDPEEGSSLHRFSDEQPRAAQNLEKMYLSGVFGGVPEYASAQG